MGIFSKLWKGIKKTFKTIFKPIKKVFKTIGKFVNKLGIVGQIAMMFIPIPGLSTLFSGLGKAGSEALDWLAKKGAVGSAAASVIGSAAKFVGAVAKPFVNITKGVKGFFENITKYTLNKIPGINIASAPTSIFGEGGAWSQASEAIATSFKDFKGDIASAASMDISDILPKATNAPTVNLTEATDKIASESNYLTPEMPEAVVSDPVLDVEPSAAPSGSVTETLGKETKGFFGNMQDKMLAPYKEFFEDPKSTISNYAGDALAKVTEPISLLNRPDTPKASKRFDPMYISQQKASDKYRVTTSASETIERMNSLNLLEGGYEPMPNPMMGWGGSAYRETMKNFAPGI